ncbi:MAG: hypothetical protein C0422_05345 [Alcaligenaceae bacterium]|jgi:hypothetical protein|nr:hypothetical protein [Alcaligenaceae bacterium]
MLIPMQQATQQAALIEAVRIDAKEAPNFALTIGEAINMPKVPAVPVIFPTSAEFLLHGDASNSRRSIWYSAMLRA